MKGRTLAPAGALAFVLVTVGCPKPAGPSAGGPAGFPSAAPPQPAARTDPVSGREVFQQYCAACHGSKGEGLPDLGISLRNTARQSEAEIRGVIENGRREMPDFKTTLTAEQIAAVIRHIRSLPAARTPAPGSALEKTR